MMNDAREIVTPVEQSGKTTKIVTALVVALGFGAMGAYAYEKGTWNSPTQPKQIVANKQLPAPPPLPSTVTSEPQQAVPEPVSEPAKGSAAETKPQAHTKPQAETKPQASTTRLTRVARAQTPAPEAPPAPTEQPSQAASPPSAAPPESVPQAPAPAPEQANPDQNAPAAAVPDPSSGSAATPSASPPTEP